MIHKLANGPITLTVTDLQSVEGQFGAQTQIDGEDEHGQDVRVFVSEMTAMRQLARLNLTPETVLGRTLHLKQVKKDGKTYTDIDVVRPGAASARSDGEARTESVARPASAPKMTVAEAGVLYASCVEVAMSTLGAKLEEAGVPVDAAAIQAAAATLFIRMTR